MSYFPIISEKPENAKQALQMSLLKWKEIEGFCKAEKLPEGFVNSVDLGSRTCACCAFAPEDCYGCALDPTEVCTFLLMRVDDGILRSDFADALLAASSIVSQLEKALEGM